MEAGRQHQVRNLWQYFCLAQILPPVFAFHLLQLRISLAGSASRRLPEKEETGHANLRSKSGITTILVLFITASSILGLKPVTARDFDWQVLSVVLWLRLLLFLPLFVDMSSVMSSGGDEMHMLGSQQYLLVPMIFLLAYTQENAEGSLRSIILAGFSNPAIRTLSSDWLIKLMGDVIELLFT